jgi:hypothetical protein
MQQARGFVIGGEEADPVERQQGTLGLHGKYREVNKVC